MYTGFSFLPSVATCWESTPKLLTLIRGNQPLARHPGSCPACQVTLAWMAYLSSRVSPWQKAKETCKAGTKTAYKQGYNSTCKGEKNPSDPSMKPFVYICMIYKPIYNDPRGPSCAKHFFQTKACPLVGLVGSFTLFSQNSSLFGLALLYLPYKAYGTGCFSIKIHKVNTGGRSLIAPICPNTFPILP